MTKRTEWETGFERLVVFADYGGYIRRVSRIDLLLMKPIKMITT